MILGTDASATQSSAPHEVPPARHEGASGEGQVLLIFVESGDYRGGKRNTIPELTEYNG